MLPSVHHLKNKTQHVTFLLQPEWSHCFGETIAVCSASSLNDC